MTSPRWIAAVVFVAASAVSAGVALAQEVEAQQDKEAAIRELLRLTNARSMGVQVLDQIIGMQRQAMPQVPEEFWRRMREALDADGLIEITVPIYARHFSLEEIQGLNEFYGTPLGQRFIEEQPKIMAESMEAGASWGRRLMEKLEQELREAGYEKAAD